MRIPAASLLTAFLCAAAFDANAAFLVNFNSASDLNNFRERGGGVPSAYTWTGLEGVGSPLGAVTSANTGATSAQNLYYTAQTFNPALNGDALTISVFLLANANTGTGDSRNFVGFAASTSTNLSTDASKLGVRIFKSASTSQFVFQLQNGTSVLTLGSSFDMLQDHWYRASVSITRTGSNTFQMSGELLDYGLTGTDLNPSFSRSGSTNSTNGNMGTAWTAGLLNQINNGGAVGFDNLAVATVPEPGSLVLLALAGIALTVVRRRPSTR